MKLIFIRHGETLWNREFRMQGVSDVALSDVGVAQSVALARGFKWQIDKVFTSPLDRAVSFAEPLAARRKMTPEIIPELREMSFGRWEGLRYADMDDEMKKGFEEWCVDPVNVCPPEGEAAADMGDRVRAAVDKISQTLGEDETAAVVTHGGLIRVAVTLLMELPPVTAARMQIETGSLTVLEYVAGYWRLVKLNDTCHLQENGEEKGGL
ncbi:histidine phosphatase family protein [Dethiobacter alkaliphilus]|uniref:histidine phosphatase family protein n=1 Tax=Dethiobacter alkaliphilus TaxID=427926 RepID=UPI0022261EE8|nr:histidine phosphatase family protein [Dethiobacter alkaliphilus]MCW3491489.1 histidine phosphatase family protein [Dethiobacter alkaliphilus]